MCLRKLNYVLGLLWAVLSSANSVSLEFPNLYTLHYFSIETHFQEGEKLEIMFTMKEEMIRSPHTYRYKGYIMWSFVFFYHAV